jgi:hypothetical protein
MSIRFWSARSTACTLAVFTLVSSARAEDPALADFFGFEGLEVVKIDRGAGPIITADMNGDGLTDLIAVNNFASRIELHYQKKNASPTDEVVQPTRVNEFPEHWRFRREYVSVTHQVTAVIPYDFNGDGLMDLIYTGNPAEIVFLRQKTPGVFEISRKHAIKNLAGNRNALAIKDVLGDSKPELLSLVNGKINIWPLNGDNLGQPVELSAGPPMVAFEVEDYNGDGRLDIAGIIPEDPAPVRLWLGSMENGKTTLGAQVSFEMPPLREFEPVRLPNEKACRIATIERASKRIVLYEVATDKIESSGDRDAALSVFSFTDSGKRKRNTAVVDVDGDGLVDLVASDTESNALVVYKQIKGKGLQAGESYPSLSDIGFLAAGNVDADPHAEIFVLSEKEGVVGRCDVTADGIPFPKPLNIPDGNTPVAMNLVELEGGPQLAVVAKSGKEYVMYLINMNGERQTISLGSQSRSPDTIIGLDANQDGKTDLLLFTRDKPMTMLLASDSPTGATTTSPTGIGFKLMESKDMGQFGLVQAANAANTAVYDIDGNGKKELLVADKNYVRAVRYDPKPTAAGVSPGWQVVQQINAKDSSAKLVSIAVLGNRIVAADKENSRLVVMAQTEEPASKPDKEPQPPSWNQVESLKVRGFSFNSIYAGAFSGDGKENILAVGDDGFAVINLEGERVSLKQFAAWRTDEERRVQHELTAGDINGDGYTDLVSLDAGEQMCEIFTITDAHRLLYCSGFKVFESKLFTSGEPREFQPSQCIIADVTGDGANDLVLLSHDRVLIYPQMTKAIAAAASKK